MSVKNRIFEIIQIGTRVDFWSHAFDLFISVMIVASIAVTFLYTFDSLAEYRDILMTVEGVTIFVFIIEYCLRLFTSDLLYPNATKIKALLGFVFSLYGIIDLLTIISYFSPVYSNGFVAFRLIRVVRIFRLFMVNSSFDAFNIVTGVIQEKKSQIVSSIFMIIMLMMAASLCMYGLEHEVQPDSFSNAFSGIWWAMSTVLTVGYGDIYPITVGGRIVAIIIALLGVCVVAIPTGVISAGFVEYYTRIKNDNDDIHLSPEVGKKLKKLADEEGVSKSSFVEHLIIDLDK